MPSLRRNHSSRKYNQEEEEEENLKNSSMGWVSGEEWGGIA